MKQSTIGHNKTGFQSSIAMCPAFDTSNPKVPGMKDDDQKTKAMSFRGWQYSDRSKYLIKNIYLLGTSRKMKKNYVEIFISGSINVEFLILTMKTIYFVQQWFWNGLKSDFR